MQRERGRLRCAGPDGGSRLVLWFGGLWDQRARGDSWALARREHCAARVCLGTVDRYVCGLERRTGVGGKSANHGLASICLPPHLFSTYSFAREILIFALRGSAPNSTRRFGQRRSNFTPSPDARRGVRLSTRAESRAEVDLEVSIIAITGKLVLTSRPVSGNVHVAELLKTTPYHIAFPGLISSQQFLAEKRTRTAGVLARIRPCI